MSSVAQAPIKENHCLIDSRVHTLYRRGVGSKATYRINLIDVDVWQRLAVDATEVSIGTATALVEHVKHANEGSAAEVVLRFK